MHSRRSSQEQVAEVARRRLELLSAELAEIRPERPPEPPMERPPERAGESRGSEDPAGSGEPRPAGRHAHRSLGLNGLVSGWARDRLPATMQGGTRMSAAHLAVVALVLAAGVLATAWWVLRGQGGETALPAVALPPSPLVTVPSLPTSTVGPSVGAAGPTRSAGAPAASPSVAASVVVDVAGRVRQPGIATLPAGARVVDALRAAGGARRGVPLGSLNLARVLADGEQIVVGVRAPPGVAASAASAPQSSPSGTAIPMVDINTAGQPELEQLPGVGPVTAQSILAFRSERGTFTSVDELLEVSGIGDATLAKIAPYVTL